MIPCSPKRSASYGLSRNDGKNLGPDRSGRGLTGVAAALAVKGGVGVKEIDVKELQRVLTENGAFIG